MELAGKLIGYIAVVISVLIYQQKTRTGLLLFKGLSDIFWITHYLLLGGYTGAAVTAIALIRTIVFFKSNSRDTNGRIILVCFLCASIVSGILTWGSIFSLFAMLGSMTAIVSFWIGKPNISRILAFPVSVCMLIYGASNGSTAVILNEILVLISSTLGILRHDRKPRTAQEK